MSDYSETAAIRRRLKHSWLPFFARFGRLTQIQLSAIPRILDGRNVAVASPTASGKTEAVVAPVAERFLTERWDGLAIVYVVPTRALANDTLARLAGPLSDMTISSLLKHGDRPQLPRSGLPNCLITTPESLDSLICRRAAALESVRAVILDEIHLLDNTYRGDQLRVLLRRLRSLAGRDQSIYLLSATLAEPVGTAVRYASACEVVSVPGQREMDCFILDSIGDVLDLARQRGWSKILCFCNLRESVEAVASALVPLCHPYPVFAHHGSLDKRLREEAETVMKEAGVAACVATSTLEIGVDIGDVDLVVLAEIPWSISALLQRVGRGNRREGLTRVAAVAESAADRSILEAMFHAARGGQLPVQPYQPDLSVAVQQFLSMLYQQPEGVLEERLAEPVSPLCTSDQAHLILGHLTERGWAEWRNGRWFASTKLMDTGEKGRIHSNIPDSQAYRVVDVSSGREIGRVAGVFDDVFVLARRAWRVVSVVGDVIQARQFAGKASAPMFVRNRGFGAFYHLLPPSLRKTSGSSGCQD